MAQGEGIVGVHGGMLFEFHACISRGILPSVLCRLSLQSYHRVSSVCSIIPVQ